MKNYVESGETLTVAAPYAVASGAGALITTLFGVAQADAASGASVVLVTRGVFDLAKTSAQAWAVGAAIYWDDTNKVATTTSSGNTRIGTAVAAAANPSATGRVFVSPRA